MTDLVEVLPATALATYNEHCLELPPDLSFEAWESIGQTLARMERSVSWWLGDWYRHGERAYGEAAAQAAPTGYALKTCQNAAWVAEHVEPSRRRENLTFAHHSAIAALPPAKQDAYLDEAERESLSSRKLAQRVQGIQPAPKPHKPADANTAALVRIAEAADRFIEGGHMGSDYDVLCEAVADWKASL